MYKLLTTDGRAKRGTFETVHGTIQTPVFMNVGTAAAIKGAVATTDLQQIKPRWNYQTPIIYICVRETRW